jgi:hypothetical protein
MSTPVENNTAAISCGVHARDGMNLLKSVPQYILQAEEFACSIEERLAFVVPRETFDVTLSPILSDHEAIYADWELDIDADGKPTYLSAHSYNLEYMLTDLEETDRDRHARESACCRRVVTAAINHQVIRRNLYEVSRTTPATIVVFLQNITLPEDEIPAPPGWSTRKAGTTALLTNGSMIYGRYGAITKHRDRTSQMYCEVIAGVGVVMPIDIYASTGGIEGAATKIGEFIAPTARDNNATSVYLTGTFSLYQHEPEVVHSTSVQECNIKTFVASLARATGACGYAIQHPGRNTRVVNRAGRFYPIATDYSVKLSFESWARVA